MQFLGDFLDELHMAAVYLNEIGDLEGLREMQIELEWLIAEDPILVDTEKVSKKSASLV